MNDQSSLLEALTTAMKAEQKASQFYAAAAAKTQNAKGRNMLQQLSRFEQSHFEALDKVRRNLEGEKTAIDYAGTEFEPVPSEVASAPPVPEKNLDEVLDILKIAIKAEDDAHSRYAGMAEQAQDEEAKALFRKLAVEETDHRRILADEFYQLTNADGTWRWGE